ncbi:MAG: hypothetical protein ACR2J8_13220 [Thermomicrobiales bacterium]
MRVIRDVGYIKRRKRVATLTAIGGVALLGFAFWLSVSAGAKNTSGILLAYIPLLAGTALFHMGMQQVSQWNRTPRNDESLDALLKPLGEKYTLMHFVPAGNKRIVPHVLVHPGGVLSLSVRDLAGDISYADGKWRKSSSGGISRLFGMGGPQLGNPSADAATDVAALEVAFAGTGTEAFETDGAVVFLNRLANLVDIDEPDFPVMNGEGLLQYIRSLPADPDFKTPDRQAVVELLAQGEEVEEAERAPTRRPVKRRAA